MLNVPLYDGGARYGAMRDARAAARASASGAHLDATRRRRRRARAYRAVGVTQASRDVAKRSSAISRSGSTTRTRDGYAHGLGTSLDLVISAQALRQAEINLALLDFQVAQARADAVLANAECLY